MLRALGRLGARLTRVTIRWVPDAWVVAVLLTLLVWILAVVVADAPLLVGEQGLPACGKTRTCGAFDAWSGGIWRLLKLTGQFALALVAAQAVATSRPVYAVMKRLASLPAGDRPRQAIVLMALFSVGTAYLNWAVNLVMCATFVPIVAARNPRVDFRLLVASAYIGLGAIWHAGLSGSAPLIAATPGSFLIKQGVLTEPLPIAATLLAPFNLVYVVLMGAFMVAVAAALHPEREDAKPLPVADALDLVSPPTDRPARADLTPAGRLDHARWLSLLVGAAVLGHLGSRFVREGTAGWDIDG